MKKTIADSKTSNQNTGKIANIILLLLSSSYVVVTLLLNSKFNCDALSLSVVPCVAALLLLLSGIKKAAVTKGEKIAIYFFSLLFMIMLSFVDIVNNTVVRLTGNTALQVVISVYYFFAVYCATVFSIEYLFALFMKNRENAIHGKTKDKPYIIYIIIIALFTILFLLAAGYGYDGFDTITVYSYYKDRGIWLDWHTVSYEMLMALSMKLIPGAPFVYSLILVQSAMWIGVSAFAIKSLYDEFGSLRMIKAYTLLSVIIIAPAYYASIGIKDTVFSMFTYAFSISIFNVLRKTNPDKKDYVILAVNSLLASLFRHAAVETVALTLIILFTYRVLKYKEYKRIKRYIILCLVPVVGFVGITVGIGDGVLHKYKNPEFVKYTMPIYLAISCADSLKDDFGEDNKKVFERIAPMEDWLNAYHENEYWADTVSRDWGGIGNKVYDFDSEFYSGVIKTNADLVLHYPGAYFNSVFKMTSIVWRVGNPRDCDAFYPSGKGLKEHELYRPSVAGDIITSIVDFSADNVYLCSVTWRGGFWILTAVFSSIVLIRKKRAELMFMILPVVLFAASLFISIPAQDPRYVLSFIEVGTAYALIALFSPNVQLGTVPN